MGDSAAPALTQIERQILEPSRGQRRFRLTRKSNGRLEAMESGIQTVFTYA